MIERRLGKTGMDVSVLGLGCYQFTEEFNVMQDAAYEILDYAMDNGITYYDTAEMYGWGESEELLGRALARHRDNPRLCCSTKMGYCERSVKDEYANTVRQTCAEAFVDPVKMMRALKHSMWLLQKDVIDIFNIHEPDWPQWQIDYETASGAAIEFLLEAKKEGLVRSVGFGGWDYHGLARLVKSGKFDFVLPAGGMSLLSKPIYDELIPACVEQGVGVALGGGFGQNTPFLIVKDRRWMELLKPIEDERVQNVVKKLERIYRISDETGISLPELTIRYIINHEEIATHVAGARELAHVRQNIESAEKGPLPQDVFRELEEVQAIGECLPIWDLRDLSRELVKKLDHYTGGKI